MKRSANLAVLAAGTLWGSMGIFVRVMNAAGLSSMEVVALRILSGCLLVGLFLLLGKRELFRVRLRDLWCFVGTGIVSLLLFSYCYFTAMNHTSIAVAGVLLYTAPIGSRNTNTLTSAQTTGSTEARMEARLDSIFCRPAAYRT